MADGLRRGNGKFEGTDNTHRLQAILDSLAKLKQRINVTLYPGNYRITSTLTIDIRYISISGSGARLLYDGNGIALRIFGSGYPPYDQAVNETVNLEIRGKANDFYYKANDANNSTGILFESFGNSTSGGTHHRLQGLVISNFGTGVKYGADAYCIDISHSQISYCSVGVHCSSAPNSGERISFYNVSLFNCNLAIRDDNPNSNLNFLNCSIDYNVKQIEITGGKIFCSYCHFETDRKQSIVTNFTVTGNGSFLQITNSTFLQDYKEKPLLKYLIEAGVNATAVIKDCFMSGIYTTSGELATGGGVVEINRISSFEQSNNTQLTSLSNNMLVDGGFEEQTVADHFFITDDVKEVKQRLNGANIKIETTGFERKTGKSSLKITKTYGSGSNCGFIIAVPVTLLEKAAFRCYIKTASIEKKYITYGYAAFTKNEAGVDIVTRKTVSGAAEVTNINSWTVEQSSDPNPPAPAWATHYYVYFNLFNASSSSFYIDDFIITKM